MTKQTGWSSMVNPAVRDLPPSGIRRFFDLVTEIKEVISLGVGEPDFEMAKSAEPAAAGDTTAVEVLLLKSGS